ncbi:helix-turn-helix transcriptional regulator [Xanthocytophaga flava]|uniref:helix-turn-helix transcriptional regulator n=1 Tax=Xanthocytophaga flava TaxID=3048013 RepID=UPI0028D4C1D5|nr:helix-turn-helix domain-containing protein [Xanthocytophaga flavus]MDJ1468606.1 helix-turn-helix domain-containing protein [Xanthocytophaga flavus]
MSEVIANNIKYLRRMNGLTQEQFARKIGIKRSLLGAYEEGRANPNLENLTNIAKIFGTTVDNLIKNDIRNLREKQGIPIPQPAPQLMEPNDPNPPKPVASIIDKYYQPQAENPILTSPTFTPTHKTEPVNTNTPYTPPSNDLFQKPQSSLFQKSLNEEVFWIAQKDVAGYLTGYAYKDYLEKLPQLSLPTLPSGKYRAFEVGSDFPVAGATVIGEFTPNWYDIRDGQHYIIVLHKQGILYRRIYNHVKIKGTILLLSDSATIPTIEVPVKDVLELWEARQYIGLSMPEPKTSLPLERLMALVAELQREIESLQK